jgi:hypothetical protein
VTSDNDAASSSFLALFHEVQIVEAFPFVCCPELLGKIVVTDATGVSD